MPPLRLREAGGNARERLRSLVRVHAVSSAATPARRRLLCVLLIWLRSVSAATTRGRHSVGKTQPSKLAQGHSVVPNRQRAHSSPPAFRVGGSGVGLEGVASERGTVRPVRAAHTPARSQR